MKNLVVYFSASGVTEKLAKRLAEAIGSDIFEIVPRQKYTDKDLDWTDKNSRSSLEMADINSRPEIIKINFDIKNYDNIFIGFPIWWYREPSVVDTFLEQYDFKNKRIIPFATSGGSGMGDTYKYIQSVAKNAVVEKGKRFSATSDSRELLLWAKTYI